MRIWKKCTEHGAFLFGLLVIAVFCLWRIQYGNAEVDEAFYLTVPFRMLKGDSLLTDEWHVAQLTGFLQAPLMLLQRLLFGGMEGVVLHFRAFWLVGHLMVMTLSYALLAQENRAGAAAASWVYGLSVPFGLMAPGYYTMGVASVYLLAALFYGQHCSWKADLLKGALMARGTREIGRLIQALGGQEHTAYGLSHLGDYEATVFSPHSHNRAFGEAFARGEKYTQLAEGAPTTRALCRLAQRHGVELPICRAVEDILYNGCDPRLAMDTLFARDLKREF